MKNKILLLLGLTCLASPISAAWVKVVKIDPLTRAREVSVDLRTQGGLLSVFCSDQKRDPILMFATTQFLGSTASRGWQEFDYKFDDGKPHMTKWQYQQNSAATRDKSEIKRFVAESLVSSRLLVRAFRYDGSYIDFNFNLEPPQDDWPVDECGVNFTK